MSTSPPPRPTAQPLPVAPEPTVEQVIAELGRELGVRRGCFPRWAAERRQGLGPDEYAHRLACMAKALHLLQQHLPPPAQGSLF